MQPTAFSFDLPPDPRERAESMPEPPKKQPGSTKGKKGIFSRFFGAKEKKEKKPIAIRTDDDLENDEEGFVMAENLRGRTMTVSGGTGKQFEF